MIPMSPIAVGLFTCAGLLIQLHSSLSVADVSIRSRYLLLDDRLIEEKQHVRLGVGTTRKYEANPLMREDKPWEPRFDNMYPTLIYDKR